MRLLFLLICALFMPLACHAQEDTSVEQMLGSMLMFGFRGTALETDNAFAKMIASGKIGNVALFDKDVTTNKTRNIESPEQLKKLNSELKKLAPHPMFIAVDQEGGQVRRLKTQKGFMDLPSAQRLGQGNVHDTMQTAEELGKELADLGINVDLAPVVDVDVNPFNPSIGKLGRAFNTDPTLVAQHALAFGQGLVKNGVVPVLKHFPGQGCAQKDTHLEPADISQCWNANVDLLPYAEIFKAGWPGMVMVGHLTLKNLDPNLPATLSANIIQGLLRCGLGWQGVIMTDDLQMAAVSEGRNLKELIRLAVEAGNDILLFGNNISWDENLAQNAYNALLELHNEGAIPLERIKESWQRIKTLHDVYAKFHTQ